MCNVMMKRKDAETQRKNHKEHEGHRERRGANQFSEEN
jgi:hypothetical protein